MSARALGQRWILEEILEQPQAVARTVSRWTGSGCAILEEAGLTARRIRGLSRVVIVGSGTAYHAAVSGRYAVTEWVRIPCQSDLASEWCDRNPMVSDDTLVVGISHSGEDADTVAAIRLARQLGAWTVAVTEMSESPIASEAAGVLATRAGAELGTAETKAFTAQVALVYLFALALAEMRGGLAHDSAAAVRRELETAPRTIAAYLDAQGPVEEIAAKHQASPFFLYLGRHLGLPVCLEGALKLKEMSGIPTEAYAAGEMKHGPIALIDETTPIVCVATDSHVYEKVVSNIQEARARGAQIVAVATEGNDGIRHDADDVVFVPRIHPFLQPLLAVIPLQLFAYCVAVLRGRGLETLPDLVPTTAAT